MVGQQAWHIRVEARRRPAGLGRPGRRSRTRLARSRSPAPGRECPWPAGRRPAPGVGGCRSTSVCCREPWRPDSNRRSGNQGFCLTPALGPGSAPPVVIRADNITLGDLGLDPRPRPTLGDHDADVGYLWLIASVVKVQDHDVSFTAVHARVPKQVSPQEPPVLSHDPASADGSRLLPPVGVAFTLMRSVVVPLAALADRLTTIALRPVQGKLSQQLRKLAGRTDFPGLRLHTCLYAEGGPWRQELNLRPPGMQSQAALTLAYARVRSPDRS